MQMHSKSGPSHLKSHRIKHKPCVAPTNYFPTSEENGVHKACIEALAYSEPMNNWLKKALQLIHNTYVLHMGNHHKAHTKVLAYSGNHTMTLQVGNHLTSLGHYCATMEDLCCRSYQDKAAGIRAIGLGHCCATNKNYHYNATSVV